MSAFIADADVVALVDRAREGARAALLTNNGPLVLAAMDRELADVGRRFDPWGFACRYEVAKPDPAIFAALCAETAVDPGAILFVDDSEQHVEAAARLGLRAHHFTTPEALAVALEQAGL